MKKYFWFIILLVLCSCGLDIETKKHTEPKDTLITFAENEVLVSDWVLGGGIGKMCDGATHYAALMSSNTITQRFPYGETNSTIAIRNTKKFGNEVVIIINRGQIYGNEIEVRFDNEEIKRYTFSIFGKTSQMKSKANSLNKIVIDNPNDFIENCKVHKNIKVRIPLFREGKRVFKYNAYSLLDWEW